MTAKTFKKSTSSNLEFNMDELERRRIDRLNKEYKQTPQYVTPVFSNKHLFWMTVVCGIGVAMVSYALL